MSPREESVGLLCECQGAGNLEGEASRFGNSLRLGQRWNTDRLRFGESQGKYLAGITKRRTTEHEHGMARWMASYLARAK